MVRLRLRRVLPALGCVALLAASVVRTQAGEPKLTAEEVLAKHLDSIAPAEARGAARSRAAEWNVRYVIKMGGQGFSEGKAVFITEGRKVGLGMRFPVNDYPGEKFVFDGEKYDTAMIIQGQRSPLGDLVLQENEVLREGLLGGAFSTAWPLLDLKAREGKLKYDGVKKVNGVQAYRLSYLPKKVNNGLEILLYFDVKTFRHIKTEYKLEIQPGFQAVQYTGKSNTRYTPNTRYTLEESFSEFESFDGFTLPTKWKIAYTWEPASGSGETNIEWNLALVRVIHNSEVDPKTFTIQ